MNRNPLYPFTEADAEAAYNEWGANCGPNALAFALNLSLDAVRYAIPDFDAKRYASPTMMKGGLLNLHARYSVLPIFQPPARKEFPASAFSEDPALVRIQWCGPWTAVNANPKWAYRQTHWICTFKYAALDYIFDCNGGVASFEAWKRDVVPLILKCYPRADGDWFPTHIWRIG